MNAAFQLVDQPKPVPLQNLFPPPNYEMKGRVKYEKLNRFATRERVEKESLDEIEMNSIEFKAKKMDKWTLDIPMMIVGNGPAHRNAIVRITIESDFNRPFPQSHKISICDPTDDIFFHWTFACTPFSYKTLTKQMQWTLPQTAGTQTQEHFKSFASLVQQCAKDTLALPDRYRAIFLVHGPSAGTLSFREIINQYRKMDLLSMDVTPSPFSDLKRDVTEFTKRIFEEHQECKVELVQILEKVATHQPSILLHSNGLFDSLQVHQPDEWIQAQERLNNPPSTSIKERSERIANFLAETHESDLTSEIVLTKPFTLPVVENNETVKRDLIFTFHYTVFLINVEI